MGRTRARLENSRPYRGKQKLSALNCSIWQRDVEMNYITHITYRDIAALKTMLHRYFVTSERTDVHARK